MGSYCTLHLAVDFQLTVNDDETGIYYATCKPRRLGEGRKVRQQNPSEGANPELKPRDKGIHEMAFHIAQHMAESVQLIRNFHYYFWWAQ